MEHYSDVERLVNKISSLLSFISVMDLFVVIRPIMKQILNYELLNTDKMWQNLPVLF